MIEPRMYEAAFAVYAERGWYGFSLEAVSRQAGVGQGAVYRRWSSKAALLAEAVSYREPSLEPINTGSTRGDLVALARHFLLNYRDSVGVVGLRMVLDARTNPELAQHFDAMLKGSRAAEARRLVRRASERGDLRRPTSVDLVLEILSGTTLSHVLWAPQQEASAGATTAADDRFIGRLVDSLLAPQ
jgi:AcrR family transcriptional regulator